MTFSTSLGLGLTFAIFINGVRDTDATIAVADSATTNTVVVTTSIKSLSVSDVVDIRVSTTSALSPTFTLVQGNLSVSTVGGGTTGQQGATGPTGQQGATGVTGPAGSQTPWTQTIDGASNALKNVKTVTFPGEFSNGNSGATSTIDWTAGNKQVITLATNSNFVFTAPLGTTNLILRVVQDATGARTVVWPGAVKWISSAAPTLTTAANAVDIVSLYYNGTNYYASFGLNFG